MKTIKIAKVPGAIKEVAVPANATLGEVLDTYAAEFSEEVSGYELRVGDNTVGRDYTPADGAKVYLVKMVKGN